MSLIAEAPGFLQVYSDVSVKRFNPEIAPNSAEFSNGYKSKDVIVDPSKPITTRIFLPDSPSSSVQLPILLYFQGDGFCIGYHHFLGNFSVTSQSIVLTVDYRLTPEHGLPTAYEDCHTTLEWLSQRAKTEP
ncbi:hypothetical protein L6164_024309 [Bauhinia variegata]|uniref:Uncharacterized protein n=1 Tax=Bauhinia variegata TaxID=167791 RepID=A0ACB9LWW0_BAUVA|nr:hypothetical protein L6164_024309 [Bauhinia variegata]